MCMDGKLFDSYLESKQTRRILDFNIKQKKQLYDNAERLQCTFVYKKKLVTMRISLSKMCP